jgi:hypothetical protein
VWFPVFEEPSVRGGREKTKTNENNDCNQNSYSERNHAAPLVFAVLKSAHRKDQSNLNYQETHYAYRFRAKYPIGGR